MSEAEEHAKKIADYRLRFQEQTKKSVEGQLEFFLKRYIFVLGEDWKKTADLATKFGNYTDARNGTDLNVTEAADFLQKNGKTRTAKERSEELRDIDLDNNGRICFLEYLLLHYKVMVLTDFFRTKGEPMPSDIDLSKDGIGVTGVGDYILEALFMVGSGIDPKVEEAIEEVIKSRKEREDQMGALQATVEDTSKNQVQRMKAQHELLRMEKQGNSEADIALIHLMAARRKASKYGGERALKQKEAEEAAEKKKKADESKNKLGAMMKSFQDNAKTDPKKYQNKAADRASIKAINSKGLNLYTEAARKDI